MVTTSIPSSSLPWGEPTRIALININQGLVFGNGGYNGVAIKSSGAIYANGFITGISTSVFTP